MMYKLNDFCEVVLSLSSRIYFKKSNFDIMKKLFAMEIARQGMALILFLRKH